MSWIDLTLGDALRVKHGFAFKGEFFAQDGTLLVVTPGNFVEAGGFRVRPGKERYYTSDFPEDYLLCRDDLIIAMTEQGEGLLGSAARIPEDGKYLHNQRIGLIAITRSDLLEQRFVYWLFNSRSVREQLRGSSTGTKVKHTAPERIYKVRVRVPGVEAQERIAALLDTYNDLIENNQRRIALLEESARLLFKKWFATRLLTRADGYEKPEGCCERNLYDIADLTMGYPFQSALFNAEGDGRPAVRIRDIPSSTVSTWTTEDPGDPSYEILQGDLLVGMDGIFHMNHWVGEPSWLVQRVCRIRPKNPLHRGFLALALAEPIKHFEATIAGATVAHLGAKHLRAINLVMPPESMQCELQHLNDLLDQRLKLHAASELAKKARNALLPKLLSGDLTI